MRNGEDRAGSDLVESDQTLAVYKKKCEKSHTCRHFRLRVGYMSIN